LNSYQNLWDEKIYCNDLNNPKHGYYGVNFIAHKNETAHLIMLKFQIIYING